MNVFKITNYKNRIYQFFSHHLLFGTQALHQIIHLIIFYLRMDQHRLVFMNFSFN